MLNLHRANNIKIIPKGEKGVVRGSSKKTSKKTQAPKKTQKYKTRLEPKITKLNK